MARRLMHLFSHGRLVVVNSDMMWRSKLFVSLREQSRMLERISGKRRMACRGWKRRRRWRCRAPAWTIRRSAWKRV
jgi:uncharacterized heparinase superfamily protein